MSLWIACATHVLDEADLVLMDDLRRVFGDRRPTPNKTKILFAFFLSKFIENSPEALDDLTIMRTVCVRRDILKLLHLNF